MDRVVGFLETRVAVFAGVILVAVFLLLAGHGHGGIPAAWRLLHIPAMSPDFSDTRTITHSIDCVLHGEDPYTERRFDPYRRVYNYPPLWLDLRYLGVTSRSTELLGLLSAAMIVSVLLLLFRARRLVTALMILFAVTSEPVLLAVERGNTDLVIFFLMVFGLFVIQRQRASLRMRLKGVLLVLLTVLKIFPIAAIVILLRSRRYLLLTLITGIVAAVALVATCGHKLAFVIANTPMDNTFSENRPIFGSIPFSVVLTTHLLRHLVLDFRVQHAIAGIVAVLVGVLSVSAGAMLRERLDRVLPRLDLDTARGCLASAGLAIFCFAFCSGSSYDYRLVFLLGVLAYLFDEFERTGGWRALPMCLLFLLFLWSPFQPRPLLGEVLDGAVFAVSCAWLGRTLMLHLVLAGEEPADGGRHGARGEPFRWLAGSQKLMRLGVSNESGRAGWGSAERRGSAFPGDKAAPISPA